MGAYDQAEKIAELLNAEAGKAASSAAKPEEWLILRSDGSAYLADNEGSMWSDRNTRCLAAARYAGVAMSADLARRVVEAPAAAPRNLRTRLYPFRVFLEHYDEKAVEWAKDKDEFGWPEKLQDELNVEVKGILDGTHEDNLKHELLQIATIAYHWYERLQTPECDIVKNASEVSE